MVSSLQDKVVIVTGSSSGIGEVIALTFATRGAKVTLTGRDQERLKSVFDKLVEVSGGHQDKFLIVQVDLSEQRVRQELVAKTVEKFGRLDILVANVGVTSNKGSISTAIEESYDTVMDTNLKSAFFLIQQAVPHLEKSKGNIINISSIASSIVVPRSTVYSMSKVALDHLTKCLAVDLGSKRIRANSVSPAYIPIRILRTYGADAEAVAFLASDAAGFITGEIINVDGGRKFAGSVK